MFEDKYKQEMESVKLSDKTQINAEKLIKRANASRKAVHRKWISLAAASLLVISGTVLGFPALHGNNNSPAVSQTENRPIVENNSFPVNDIQELCLLMNDRFSVYKSDVILGNTGRDDNYIEETGDGAPTYTGSSGSTDNFINNFSDVNNQADGVQEADVIRTDGKFIYIASGTHFTILKAEDGKINECCDIDLGDSFWFDDIMLCGKKVIIVGQTANVIGRDADTILYVFEINENGNAVKTEEFFQSGVRISLRAIGNVIYVITRDANYLYETYSKNGALNADEIAESLPIAGEDRDDTVHLNSIYVPDEICSVDFTVVSAFDTASGESKSTAIMGGGSNVYADEDTIYVYGTHHKPNEDETTYVYSTYLTRFSIIDNAPVYTGNTYVNGYCLNQYSLDEFNGYLRLAITRSDGQTQNGVVVLDEKLELVGEIMGLGVNEQIKSVRFDRETVYLVTFRTTDPLYAVDLSDPTTPKVRSELKLPGYSGYMQSYGSGLLFGFGYDADENSGSTNGLKLSMFDNSDPDNLAEKHTLLLGPDTFFRDNMLKAVSVQPKWNIIMFSYGKYEQTSSKFSLRNVFALYSYSEENGFELLGEYASDMVHSMAYRCFYINGYVYVVYIQQGDYSAYSFTASDFTLTDSLE